MSKRSKESALSLIKSLKALSLDPAATEGEREAALARISHLLEEYSLDEAELKEFDVEERQFYIPTGQIGLLWLPGLVVLIAEIFACETVTFTVKDSDGEEVITSVLIVGTSLDVQVAYDYAQDMAKLVTEDFEALYYKAREDFKVWLKPKTDKYGNKIYPAQPHRLFTKYNMEDSHEFADFFVDIKHDFPSSTATEWKRVEDSVGQGFLFGFRDRMEEKKAQHKRDWWDDTFDVVDKKHNSLVVRPVDVNEVKKENSRNHLKDTYGVDMDKLEAQEEMEEDLTQQTYKTYESFIKLGRRKAYKADLTTAQKRKEKI